MTPDEAKKIVAVLVAAYPVPSWEGPTLALYRRKLLDLNYAAAGKAVSAWIDSQPRAPAISDLRSAVLTEQRRRKDEARLQELRKFDTKKRLANLKRLTHIVKEAVSKTKGVT